MGNNYTIYDGCNLLKGVRYAACFSELRSFHILNKNIRFIYFPELAFSQTLTNQWHELCNDWGLVSERQPDGQRGFKIGPREFYHALLAPAVARRYLEEGGITAIARKTFEFIKKYPKEDTLDLFQLAHYYTSQTYNYNHTFLSLVRCPYDKSYDGNFRYLVDRDDIYQNLNKSLVTGGAVGLNRIFRKSENALTDIPRKDYTLPENPLDLLALLKK